ncbi:lipopolysaccharide biosynthesis protein [uncultured Ilumatobacter sp.]|uniref:lipopolysaccharide biosynthesis protein n=1 Tax=Ilumatobacter sp. TaxID=1967498 RepID=UPI0030B32C78
MTTSDESPEPASTTRERLPIPDGTIPVGIALLIAGIATYAFFKIGNVAVGGDKAFAPITALWFATFALAPGFFLPLEQELGRALAHRRALGQGTAPVVKKVVQLGVALTISVVAVIAIASPWIAEIYFGGNWFMVVALVLAFASYAPAHLARGICSGNGRFRSYAVIMGSDGVIRILLCIALAIIGVTAVGAYGLAVAIAPLFAVAYVYKRGQLANDDGPPASWSEVTPNLGWLLLGSVFAASLLNAGPIAASLLANDDQDVLVTQFGQGVLLARIPLFLFQAVQAALLPRLSRLAAQGELDEFRSGLKRLMMVVLVVGFVGTTGAFLIGPWALEVVFDADLTGRTLALLAFSSACYMIALATAQAVIALKGHALVSIGWGIGVIAFIIGTWQGSDDVFRRVEIGLLASSIAAMVTFGLTLRYKLMIGVVPDQDSIMDAITDMPFES